MGKRTVSPNPKVVWDYHDHESLYYTFTSPRRLSWFRLCSALYLIAVNLLSILSWETLWKARDGDLWYFHFFYFTNWTLMTATLYFVLVAWRVLPYESSSYGGYVGDRPRSRSRDTSQLSIRSGGQMRLSHRKHLEIALLSVALPASILTSVVYWAAIFSPERVNTPLNYAVQVNVHVVVMVLMLVDTALTQFAFRRSDVVYTMLYGVSYHLFATVLWSYTGWWIYPFLDWTAPGWLAVYVTQVAFFAFTCLLQKFRDWLFVATTPVWLQEILDKLSSSEDSDSSPTSSKASQKPLQRLDANASAREGGKSSLRRRRKS